MRLLSRSNVCLMNANEHRNYNDDRVGCRTGWNARYTTASSQLEREATKPAPVDADACYPPQSRNARYTTASSQLEREATKPAPVDADACYPPQSNGKQLDLEAASVDSVMRPVHTATPALKAKDDDTSMA